MSSGRLIVRNSVFNLLGQVLPIGIAIAAIPALVRGLGADRFAVLTLAWAAVGYFGLFELGLSRALTQAVAQRLGNGDYSELPAIASSALLLLLALGMVGGAALAASTPLLVTRILNIPAALQRETIIAFWILAASLPLVVLSVGLRGLMEAHQHFGAATALRLPLVAFMFLGPVAVLPFSRSLIAAVLMVVAGRIVGFVAHLAFCVRRYAYLRKPAPLKRGPLTALLRFGGWTTVSNVVSPMMVFLDRFFIGALLPLAAVAHYVTPYEAVTKLLVLPTAVLGVMLPAFAANVGRSPDRMKRLYEQSLRGVVVLMFPVVLPAIALAGEGLRFWVGPILPHESTLVLQWLAVGVFVNAIAQPPLTALQSAARPDIIAKLHVIELPLYAATLVWLARRFGIPGVAAAWTLRVTVDAAALLWLTRRTLRLRATPERSGLVAVAAMLVVFAAGAELPTTGVRVVYTAATLVAYAPFAWFVMLTEAERAAFRGWLRKPWVSPEGPLEELA